MREAMNVSRRRFMTWLGGGLALAAMPGSVHAALE